MCIYNHGFICDTSSFEFISLFSRQSSGVKIFYFIEFLIIKYKYLDCCLGHIHDLLIPEMGFIEYNASIDVFRVVEMAREAPRCVKSTKREVKARALSELAPNGNLSCLLSTGDPDIALQTHFLYEVGGNIGKNSPVAVVTLWWFKFK